MGNLFIEGEWLPGHGEEFTSLNPASGKIVWQGREAAPVDVKHAIEAAKKAFATWSALPLGKRIIYLQRFGEELLAQKKPFAEVIAQETGKPLWESISEVESTIGKIPISIEAYQERCPERTSTHKDAALITYHKPHGVVAVLGPFNFPAHLPNGHIIPALLAGNTVVFKCSEQAPLVGEWMLRCWEKAGLPSGVMNLLQGGRKTGEALASHPEIDGLFFTGSYPAGLELLKRFSDHPEKILALEMGGNNPLVVADSTHPEAAAYLTVQSAYITAGQRCSCARRLIVVDGNEAYLRKLQEMISTIRIGVYTELPEPFMGPVISMQSRQKLLTAQERLIKAGGKILCEMHPLKEKLPFLTCGLIDITPIKERPDEEFFGPFLQVIRVASFEDAIAEANRTEFGLTAGLVSQSEERFRTFLHEVKAGVVNWNTPITGASGQAPFGGAKKSGNYRPSGYYAADYSAYPVASMQQRTLALPKDLNPGICI